MKFNDTKLGKWLDKYFWFILLVLLFTVIINKCNGQTSHYYIGNTYYAVLADLASKSNFVSYESVVYEDNSIALYASFQGDLQAMYSFDEDKRCILYYIIYPYFEIKTIREDLNKSCFYRPSKDYHDRWIDYNSLVTSIWKLVKSPDENELYVFVMAVDKEEEITEFLEMELQYSH
jgi:hypothetical protein